MEAIASAKGGKVLYEIVRYPQRKNGEVIVEYFFLKQRTKDMAEVTEYGKYFVAFSCAHGFIYKCFSQWTRYFAFPEESPQGL